VGPKSIGLSLQKESSYDSGCLSESILHATQLS
jgi:hypothetical protein